MSLTKKELKDFFESVAEKRDAWKSRNLYYHDTLKKIARFYVPEGNRVFEVGSGTGDLLAAVKPSEGVGIDFSGGMVSVAKRKYPAFDFEIRDAEDLRFGEKFDYILFSDLVGYLTDVQGAFLELLKVSHSQTKVLITYYNYLWEPILKFGEAIGLKMPSPVQNWLSREDIENLLYLAGFEVVKKGEELLFPIHIPLLSAVINRFLAHLPLLRRLCLVNYFIARPVPKERKEYTVSVVIPARNEKGNVEAAVQRIGQLGRHTEIVFVEGGSADGTAEEIQRVIEKYPEKDIKFFRQPGRGKKDAVWEGFRRAAGEVFMILDADLTVRPEDLSKFYNAIALGRGEFINGSRLVYPLEKQAMRFLNILANKFFGLAFSWILGQRIKDTLCGTKVFFKKDYEKIMAGRKYFGEFDPFGDFDLLFGAAKLGLKIVDLPVRYQARAYGETQISRWRHGWLLLKMTFFGLFKLKFI
ncbi:MAG TPA: bifunctional class I SAM-dependent methyltransferase/glycosyltransferase family 2 protein [Candidatus Paceibacterota bacterium]